MTIDFLLTTLIVVLIPGTGVIYTLSIGLTRGWRASIFAALGCTLGIIPSLMASMLGLAAIMHTSALVFLLIKYIGVAYLLYLAYKMWQESNILQIGTKNTDINAFKIIVRAILINALNPKLTIFFLAFLPQFINADAVSPMVDFARLSLTFMAMTFVIFCIYGLFANAMGRYIAKGSKLTLRIQQAFALFFAGLAGKLALSNP